ncbi:hypothetical protein ACA910_009754 [Epithemia clementina (nom. ined.)]
MSSPTSSLKHQLRLKLTVSLLLLVSSSCLAFGPSLAPSTNTWIRRQTQSSSGLSFLDRSSSSSFPFVTTTQLLAEPSNNSNNNNKWDPETSTTEDAPPVESPVVEEEEENEQLETVAAAEKDDDAPPEAPPSNKVDVDPELQALKDETAKLEALLKEKRRSLALLRDMADDYTKTGYARKVAEMENMRRARRMLASSNKAGSVASTVAEFLPVYDRLEELNNLYANDEFGKQYNALRSSLKQAMANLNVVEFAAAPGQEMNLSRMVVLESQYNEQQPVPNTVLQTMRPGLELEGFVVRPAEVIASLGSETTAAAAAAEEAAAVAEGEETTEEAAAEDAGSSGDEGGSEETSE